MKHGLETYGGKAKGLWEVGEHFPFSASTLQGVWSELTYLSQWISLS